MIDAGYPKICQTILPNCAAKYYALVNSTIVE